MHYAIINHSKYKNNLRIKEMYIKGADISIKDYKGKSIIDIINQIEDY